jgi:hypothetical protein
MGLCRSVRNLALAAVATSTVIPQTAQGQTVQDPSRIPRFESPLATTNRTLLASLERISRGSVLWREAVEAVRKTGRRVLVVTPADVTINKSHQGRGREAFDPGVLAETFPIVTEDSQVPQVVIVVNVRLVQETHDTRLSVPRDFEADLDRILVHEIYGHAVPYLLAGNLTGRCADPQRGESASDACSIRRENAVRAELGLGRREDHGLYSLALAMGNR